MICTFGMIYISFDEEAGHVTLLAKVLRLQNLYQATWGRISNSMRTESGAVQREVVQEELKLLRRV